MTSHAAAPHAGARLPIPAMRLLADMRRRLAGERQAPPCNVMGLPGSSTAPLFGTVPVEPVGSYFGTPDTGPRVALMGQADRPTATTIMGSRDPGPFSVMAPGGERQDSSSSSRHRSAQGLSDESGRAR